jgi:hypothetical protein
MIMSEIQTKPSSSINTFSFEMLDTLAKEKGLLAMVKFAEGTKIPGDFLSKEDADANNRLDANLKVLVFQHTDFYDIVPERYQKKAKQIILAKKNKSGWLEAAKLADDLCEMFFIPA